MLFGEVLDGAEAERVGLVWRCVDDDALAAEAAAAGRPGRAASRGSWPAGPRRRWPPCPRSIDHDEAVDLELEAQVWSLGQPEFAERLKALQSKISSR